MGSTGEGKTYSVMRYFSTWESLFSLLILLQPLSCMSHACFVDERMALMEIRSSLMRAHSKVPGSWGRGDDCCSWERVRCNNSTRRISELHLDSLSDSTSAGVGCWNLNFTVFSAFHELQLLDFSGNFACSQSLDGILGWAKLQYLDLSDNSMNGTLPTQHHLEVLDLSMNSLTGQLSTNISLVFPNLIMLNFSSNALTGSIPSSLCNSRHLNMLDLSNNNFSGEVPTCLFTNSGELLVLKLSNNKLGGLILGGKSELSYNLMDLYLDGNKIEGALPRNLSGNLHIMDFHDNKIAGEIDTSFWKLRIIGALSLAGNRLTGKIPPEICNLTTISLLDLSDNNFVGSIPNCHEALELTFLFMSGNSLSGNVPSAFFNSSSLRALDLRHNQLFGKLDWIEDLHEIRLLFLGGNYFEGQITHNLCQLQYLRMIDLSHNGLWGSLPPCIGDISFGDNAENGYFWSLPFGFSLPDSFVTDDVPYDLEGFTFATKGNLYTYGKKFFNLMTGIDLSANKLTGDIPWEMGNLSRIKSLNLSYNFFTGPIPETFSNMNAIESLDLSHNELSGLIPWQLARLTSLEVFSVAYNNLSGCIPDSGQFGSFDMDSYEGNINLHKLSQEHTCTSNSSSMVSEGKSKMYEYDPVLSAIVAASFVLTFWATNSFLFCHSLGQHITTQIIDRHIDALSRRFRA